MIECNCAVGKHRDGKKLMLAYYGKKITAREAGHEFWSELDVDKQQALFRVHIMEHNNGDWGKETNKAKEIAKARMSRHKYSDLLKIFNEGMDQLVVMLRKFTDVEVNPSNVTALTKIIKGIQDLGKDMDIIRRGNKEDMGDEMQDLNDIIKQYQHFLNRQLCDLCYGEWKVYAEKNMEEVVGVT